jgi:integrase
LASFAHRCAVSRCRGLLVWYWPATPEVPGFPGFGPHSLRRANITWRQEVGGSSIEASKISGHANTKITEEYTIVQLKRQDELTRRIQVRRAKAGKKAVQIKKESAA